MRKIIFIAAGALLFAGAVFFLLGRAVQAPPSPLQPVFHNAYFMQPDFYDRAYRGAAALRPPPSAVPGVLGILVNHHLLAAHFIAGQFAAMATTAPVTVLLVSPNHFSSGTANIAVSGAVWRTPYGDVRPDAGLVAAATAAGVAAVDESPFDQEHGISGIIPFIKKSLPRARVVPVIFKDSVSVPDAVAAADVLAGAVKGKNILVVGSFDFSHYLPFRAANFHDENSLAAVESFDFAKIAGLDIDSRPGLAFFLEFLKNNGAGRFHLTRRSNSATLAGTDVLETTSYIDGYFTSGAPAAVFVKTALLLPPVQYSAGPFFDRFGKEFAFSYLERLCSGQDESAVFVPKTGTGLNIQPLRHFGINKVSGQEEMQLLDGRVSVLRSSSVARARLAIDSGAAVVVLVGDRPGGMEMYKNGLIISGQGPGFSGESFSAGTVSVAYGFTIFENSIRITPFPLSARGGKFQLLVSGEDDTVLKSIAEVSNPSLRSQIRQAEITIQAAP